MTRNSFSVWIFVIVICLIALSLDLGSGHGVIQASASDAVASGSVATVSSKKNYFSLYGFDASPFGRLDCGLNSNTSACNPSYSEKEESLIDSWVKNQGKALISGNYSLMKEFLSSVETCADFPASDESLKSFDDSNLYGGGNNLGCNVKQMLQLMQEVKDSVFTAAQSGNNNAQIVYGDLLEYELRTAVISMSQVLNQDGDATKMRLLASAKKSEVITYAKSMVLDPSTQQKLLASVNVYQLESDSLQGTPPITDPEISTSD